MQNKYNQLNSKSAKRVFVVICIVTLIILSVFRYNNINAKYPNPVVNAYAIDVPFTYQGVEMTLTDFKILNSNDFLNDYSLDPNQMDFGIPNVKQKNVTVTLKIKNTSNMKKEINAGELMILETDGWSSYTDLMDTFRLLNPNKSCLAILEPTEETTFIFPYCLYDINFSDADFNKLESSKFKIVLSLYPVKNIVCLN